MTYVFTSRASCVSLNDRVKKASFVSPSEDIANNSSFDSKLRIDEIEEQHFQTRTQKTKEWNRAPGLSKNGYAKGIGRLIDLEGFDEKTGKSLCMQMVGGIGGRNVLKSDHCYKMTHDDRKRGGDNVVRNGNLYQFTADNRQLGVHNSHTTKNKRRQI